MDKVQRAKQSALIAGVAIGALAVLFALKVSGLLIALGFFALVAGIVLSLTIIGIVIGLPLIVVGIFGIIGGIIGSIGGVPFALLLGAGCGWAVYRYRMRTLTRHAGSPELPRGALSAISLEVQ
jgi:hypothetical protein